MVDRPPSNDNPFSEAQFKTLKYCPFFPGSFASTEEGRTFFRLFFAWYNDEHHHSGIAMLTPSTVHGGLVDEVLAARQIGLDAAYAAHPERFVAGPPVAARPPTEVWINRPTGQAAALQAPEPDAVAEKGGQADQSPPTSQRK